MFISDVPVALQESSPAATSACRCRLCGSTLSETFANLGMSPLANSFIDPRRADRMEPFYPLHAFVCSRCWLVQLGEFESPQAIFGDYLYFSSFSDSWLRHAEAYAAHMIGRLGLDGGATVVEIASNDGYLLQYFQRAGVQVLGVDPAANVARVAVDKGIPTEVAFFGAETASRLRARGVSPRLMTANNVLAHVPDMHDFLEGFRVLLAPDGVVTFEFPHLLRLMQENQFDTIYHEHFSYLSLLAVERALGEHGLTVFDIQELPTHGGSLRVFARHAEAAAPAVTPAVEAMRRLELEFGLRDIRTYRAFASRTVAIKCDLLEFLVNARRQNRSVAAYGAPAKGNTLLNYCGVGPELISFTVDRSPHKQGLLLPGTRIPILSPEAITERKPDILLILPWNLCDEIVQQMGVIRDWGGEFAVPIPTIRTL
ncbi:class I SAM-dependent methyltransferase [Roseomonas sp. NAR14]|uniref:Class I SAM-dependent methyltransferase n=1 Tax=Roseomonas acroporae TaxID=2937791 RepID=A0A9X2BVU0_9PROT|nr:class I SAM-dependent methyltransferase [Roseomonas acroporae]MCK8784349.1 class I SAM-dependent methyltransferase [Roseomonas acroporae]